MTQYESFGLPTLISYELLLLLTNMHYPWETSREITNVLLLTHADRFGSNDSWRACTTEWVN